MAKFVAILLLGGEGTRFGNSLPKQLHHIGGKPIFLHTLEAFLKTPGWEKIILVIPSQWQKVIENYTAQIKGPIILVPGGATRQSSSYKALLACPKDTDYVVIHDGVRPFVSSEILKNNKEAVILHRAVDTCIPSIDTLVHSFDSQQIESIPSRKNFLRGQTPQSFAYSLILDAHKKALDNGIENSSDDCSLVLRLSHPVKIVEGSELNIKITTELDLFFAERLLYHSSKAIEESLDRSLSGKIFAITGSTGGIGRALCKKLKELGAKTLEISKTSTMFAADLTSFRETKRTFDSIYEKYGPIDGLINSIGSFSPKDFFSLSAQEIESTIASNLTSVIYASKCVHLKQHSHIVNISSSSYSKGRKEYPIYSAAKAAVVNFTQGLAEALPNLCINTVVPQRTNTQMRREAFPEEDPSLLLSPEEVAEKITLLLRSSTTGSILEIRKNL